MHAGQPARRDGREMEDTHEFLTIQTMKFDGCLVYSFLFILVKFDGCLVYSLFILVNRRTKIESQAARHWAIWCND